MRSTVATAVIAGIPILSGAVTNQVVTKSGPNRSTTPGHVVDEYAW